MDVVREGESIKIRKPIYIEPHQNTLLKEIAQQSEMIRQAIARYIGGVTSVTLNLQRTR